MINNRHRLIILTEIIVWNAKSLMPCSFLNLITHHHRLIITIVIIITGWSSLWFSSQVDHPHRDYCLKWNTINTQVNDYHNDAHHHSDHHHRADHWKDLGRNGLQLPTGEEQEKRPYADIVNIVSRWFFLFRSFSQDDDDGGDDDAVSRWWWKWGRWWWWRYRQHCLEMIFSF